MSRKYFGTDGVRGRALTELTTDFVFKLGYAAGSYFIKEKGSDVTVIIGKDTRESSDDFENAVVAGLTKAGCNVILLGFIPTPAISFLLDKNNHFHIGVMISASHNPYYDNGIKFFGEHGFKLLDEEELAIEQIIDASTVTYEPTTANGNTEAEHNPTNNILRNDYRDFLIGQGQDYSQLKIGLDCANGATFEIAEQVFSALNANLTVFANQPNGININDNCGSTHTAMICQKVKDLNLDFAFSYDGDGDRIILIDNEGTELDGDYILFMIAQYYQSQNLLKKQKVATTVMANLGLLNALTANKIDYEITAVGDRYLMEAMVQDDLQLGGEQSGHIIALDKVKTGDGILISILLSNLFVNCGHDVASFKNILVKYPQVLQNIKVNNKNRVLENELFIARIAEITNSLKATGRVLVRASGTEDLIRIMVECADQKMADDYATELVNIAKNVK